MTTDWLTSYSILFGQYLDNIWTIFGWYFNNIWTIYIKYCYRQDLNNIWRLIGKFLDNILPIFLQHLDDIWQISRQYLCNIWTKLSKCHQNIVQILSKYCLNRACHRKKALKNHLFIIYTLDFLLEKCILRSFCYCTFV